MVRRRGHGVEQSLVIRRRRGDPRRVRHLRGAAAEPAAAEPAQQEAPPAAAPEAEPAPAVVTWLRKNSGDGLYTTAVTVAEIRYGIARLPEGRRRQSLQQAASEIFAAFPRQILPFDLAASGLEGMFGHFVTHFLLR